MPRTSALRKETPVHTFPKIYSDETLCKLCADPSRKEWAFAELYSRWQKRLFYFIQNRVHDTGRSEDLVQESFFRVSRHIEHFKVEKKFSTWLYTIASHLATNEIRNRRRSTIVYYGQLEGACSEDFSIDAIDPKADTSKLLDKKILKARVNKAIRELPPHLQTALQLRNIEDRKYDEIAEMEHIKVGTVKSRINRARNAVREILSKDD